MGYGTGFAKGGEPLTHQIGLGFTQTARNKPGTGEVDAVDQAGTLKPPLEGQDWLHLTAAQGHQSCPERGVWAEPACGACVLRGGGAHLGPAVPWGRRGGQTLRPAPHSGRHSQLFPNGHFASVQKRLVSSKHYRNIKVEGTLKADGLT